MLRDERAIPDERSYEYGALIIEAIALNRTAVIYGNVRNTRLIDNLPDGCVEVACLVDRNGVHPRHFGPLPEQLAGLNRAHMNVHTLIGEALRIRDRQMARYALLLDPLSAAASAPAELSALFDEMWEAERSSLEAFC